MSEKNRAWVGGYALALAAMLIWARDLSWISFPEDAIPLIFGLPVAFMLGGPWIVEKSQCSNAKRIIMAMALAVLALGWIIGSIALLAVSWSFVAILWADSNFKYNSLRTRLIWLLVLSFPWLVIECQPVGWALRVSSAVAAESFFIWLHLPVLREGTLLNVMGIPIEIEPACAGWNLLQLTLLMGVSMGAMEIRSTKRFYVLLVFLPLISWAANLIRILTLSTVALTFGVDVADGPIHSFTGFALLGVVIALTKLLCAIIEPSIQRTTSAHQLS